MAKVINSDKEKEAIILTEDSEPVVNKNGTKQEKPFGVSDSAWEGTQETHTVSDKVNDAQANRDAASNKYTEHTQKDMISSSTLNAMNQTFKTPAAVKEADKWLSSQLELIQSGKTSYSDQVKDMMDKIMNREKFSYDVDTDPLFQQALASAMNSGKQAMQDTIGQASALTGGYGSTYATTAGNQAYNAFIEDAYDNLPQYYQMAMEKYKMDGEEMYRQFGMVSELDDKEFNRNVMAYDATYQHRNTLYNEAYTKYRDSKSDAFAMANIEMQQYAQEGSDLYNLYTMSSNTYESLYEKDYQSWADRVNNAWKEVEVLNTDAWADKNFDESVRQYEQNYAQAEDHFTRNQEFQATESQKQRDWQTAEAEKDRAFTASENAKNRAASRSGGSGGGGGGKTSKLTNTEINGIQKVYREAGGGQKGYDAVSSYLNGLGKEVSYTDIDSYLSSASAEKGLPAYYQTWTISKDTKNWNNPFSKGNEDMNDQYTNLNGDTMSYKELKNAVNNSNLSKEDKDAFLKSLRKQGTK